MVETVNMGAWLLGETHMTLKEFRAKGGKARWRGVSKAKRKAEMRRVAKLRHKKAK